MIWGDGLLVYRFVEKSGMMILCWSLIIEIEIGEVGYGCFWCCFSLWVRLEEYVV